MSINPRAPFAGFKSPDPPESLGEAIASMQPVSPSEREAAQAGGRRHLVDRLWPSRRAWISWAAACLVLGALDLFVLQSPHPAGELSTPRLVACETDRKDGEQVAACRLDAADERLLDELNLPNVHG